MIDKSVTPIDIIMYIIMSAAIILWAVLEVVIGLAVYAAAAAAYLLYAVVKCAVWLSALVSGVLPWMQSISRR